MTYLADNDPEFTPTDALLDSTFAELISASICSLFAFVFLLRVCGGPRWVVLQVSLILVCNLANIGRVVSIRRYLHIDNDVGDILAAVFGLVYYTTEVVVYWVFVFKYYTTSTKVNQIVAKHAEAIRNKNEGKVSTDNLQEKLKKEKTQRMLAMKRHLKQRTKECKSLIFVVLVFLTVLAWMITSVIIGDGRCELIEGVHKCQFEQWLGNSTAYVAMELALCVARICTCIVFEIALVNFWRSLKTSRLIKQDNKSFCLHWTGLIFYFASEVASLTLVLIAYFRDKMDPDTGILFFANSLVWCINSSVNFIVMVCIIDRINRHYEGVKCLQKRASKLLLEAEQPDRKQKQRSSLNESKSGSDESVKQSEIQVAV